jgi:hypothetical protein
MSKSLLDFIVIGAQKARITSLFMYLNELPQIHVPPEQEASFFDQDDPFCKGFEWYSNGFFARASEHQLWGKATPNYMVALQAPWRVHEVLSDVKLVALLRHPIEWAYSNYLMSLRRGLETRSLAERIQDLIREESIVHGRHYPNETNSYIARGEYGSILANYLELFHGD